MTYGSPVSDLPSPGTFSTISSTVKAGIQDFVLVFENQRGI
jgi:hypothetical protein